MNCKNCGYGLKQTCGDFEKIICTYEEGECVKIAELEEKISVLLSCKNCPENKGGYICEKEYENKCLTQKIQFIKELQEENAELKAKNKWYSEQVCNKECAEVWGNLDKAKEIIKTFLGFAEAFGYSPSMDKFISEAKQFISEEEK